MYESRISDARWIAYDIPGNIGWIAFLAGVVLCAARRPPVMESGAIRALLLLDMLCGAAMLLAIAELIDERIRRLDRVLPKKRLYRGFGLLALAGLVGWAASLAALGVACAVGLGGKAYLLLMCGGGLLCLIFGGLLFREYKVREDAGRRARRAGR